MKKFPEERLTLVKNFPNRALAEAGKQLLERNNISSIVQSCDLAGTGALDGCDLYVKDIDAGRALPLLEAFYDSI